MIARIMESGTRLAFVLLLLFVVVMATFQPWVALGELLLVAIVYIYYRARAKRRRADIRRTVETLMFQVDDASKNSLMNFPLPTAILRIDTGEVVWCNDSFFEITGAHERMFNMHITDVMDGFDTRWIMEGRTKCPYEVAVNGRQFDVYGNIVRSGQRCSRGTADDHVLGGCDRLQPAAHQIRAHETCGGDFGAGQL